MSIILTPFAKLLLLFALVVRIVLFPLFLKGRKSMMAMNGLADQQKFLQQKYGRDRERYSIELQKLYENYADKGFNLIGVYSTEDGTAAVLADAGIGYPVVRYVPAFDGFQTGYVPTTVFLDAAGNQLGETVIGARSYEQWEEIVKGLLG